MANQTRQLARLLESDGVRVKVVQVNVPYRPLWIGSVRGLRAVFRLVPYLVRLWRCARHVRLMHVMANSGWSWHLWAAPAIFIAWLRGVPAVVNYRGGEAREFFGRSWRRVEPVMRRAGVVIVPSAFLQEVFGERGVQAVIVPNIVDLENFAPGPMDREAIVEPHLLVTRNLEPIYDIGTALRAFALTCERFPGAKLSVAGSGPEAGRLAALARELGIGDQVRFTGRIDNAEIPALYRSAHVMLNPSLVDNTPVSVLEALASGVPVVSTNVGGVPYLVEHERTALLVPPGDPARMAAAIERVLVDTALRTRLKEEGLQAAQRFTWSAVRQRLYAAYDRVLGMPIAESAARL